MRKFCPLVWAYFSEPAALNAKPQAGTDRLPLMPTLSLPGGPEVHYQEWGRADGAVMVLLHSLGSSSESWTNIGPVLGQHFRVIAPDARGHGKSEWVADYAMAGFHDDVVGLLDSLGVLAAIVVGHSMGALVAYELAATRPDLIRLLVLEEMPPPDPASPPQPLPRQSYPDDSCDWRAVLALRRWRNSPPAGAWDLAEEISAKTLIISAEDSQFSADRVAELSRRIPQATLEIVPGGHCFHETRPSELLRVVEPFVAWFAK